MIDKIYLYAIPTRESYYRRNQDDNSVICYAIAEDGECLESHCSSDIDWSKHDMGLTSDWKHDIYTQKYSDGYELEWVDYNNINKHIEFLAAFKLNQENKTGLLETSIGK